MNLLNQYTELENSRRLYVVGAAQSTATVKVNTVTAVPRTGSSPYGPTPVDCRYYETVKGRWLDRGKIAERGRTNLYRMVGDNLVASIDLLGKVDYHAMDAVMIRSSLMPRSSNVFR